MPGFPWGELFYTFYLCNQKNVLFPRKVSNMVGLWGEGPPLNGTGGLVSITEQSKDSYPLRASVLACLVGEALRKTPKKYVGYVAHRRRDAQRD